MFRPNRREKVGGEQNCQLMYNTESLGPVEYCRRQSEAVKNASGQAKKCWDVFVTMLTKLVERFDPYQCRVRENAPSLAGPFEHEDDDEHEHDFPLFPALLVGLSCSFACIRIQYQSMRWMLLN